MRLDFAANDTEALKINNDTVLLDRQVNFTSDSNGNSVVLISLQYISGKFLIILKMCTHIHSALSPSNQQSNETMKGDGEKTAD